MATPKSTPVQVFYEWVSHRKICTKENYPADLFDKLYSIQIISNCLQWYVAGARRTDSICCPPRTPFQLLGVLLQCSREVQSNPPNFFDQSDTHFKECIVCDATFHDSYQQGIGTSMKSAEISTQEAEGTQWIIIILILPSWYITKAVLFYIRKVCCLRVGKEQ